MAVKVISVPWQTGPVNDDAMVTEVETGGSKTNTAWLDVAVALTVQALLVSTQVILSLLAKPLLAKTGLSVPVACPFTNH